MFEFKGKVVVVTGAAGSLARAIVAAFFDAGANLVLIDHAAGRLEKLFSSEFASDRILLAESVDVTDPDAMAKTAANAFDRFGRVDILVNAAGGYRAGWPLHEMPLDEWDHLFNLNAKSVFVACRAFIPMMMKSTGGSIVNVSSRGGLRGDSDNAAYSASKSAVIRLTEGMADELKDHGINVNCVLPGMIDTRANRDAMPSADHSKWVETSDVANVIMYLASDYSRAIVGAAIPIYGKG